MQVRKIAAFKPKLGIRQPQVVRPAMADVETARAIFTEGRLKIIQILKVKSPHSIYALAKLLDRDFKNVYDDVTFLTQLGILEIEEASSGRHQKKPILLCDKILFEMAA